MCVGVRVRVCLCVHACVHVRMCAYVYVHVCVHVCVHVSLYVCMMLQAKPEDMDVSVLMAVQSLVESVHKHSSLLSQLYQHLLFDFRLWMNSQNHVRIGELCCRIRSLDP